MQDAMDLIVDSDALEASDLRKGFSDNIVALPGEMQMRPESLEENINRTNYNIADNIDYLDGDKQSEGIYSSGDVQGSSTLITNRSRVYKGGGWDDRAYYLIPGTRRFLMSARARPRLIPLCHGPHGHPRPLRVNDTPSSKTRQQL